MYNIHGDPANVLLTCALSILTISLSSKAIKRKPKKKRSVWVKPWIARRIELGVFHLLFDELLFEDKPKFQNFVRMDEENYAYLLSLVEDKIRKQDTNMRQSISPSYRLALTLRYLASGASFTDLEYLTRIPQCTISKIIPEVCEVIYEALKDKYMKVPSTEREWRRIATEFQDKWQFPGCLGALDGKHVVFRPSREYGSLYFNYKGTNSIVLLALVDANYNFIYVDVGVNGRNNDSSIFKASTLKEAIDKNLLKFPPPVPVMINQRVCGIPYTIVADDAFSLGEHVMKRYPMKKISKNQRIFNYRLSRARRVVENAFGILSNRFRVLLNAINLRDPMKVEKITLATVALHNFLNSKQDKKYFSVNSFDREKATTRKVVRGAWRDDEHFTIGIKKKQGGNKSAKAYMNVRDNLTKYFLYNNPLAWQEKCTNPELH